MDSLRLYTDFDPAALQFGPVEKNKKGGQFANVHLLENGIKKKVVIQTPVMWLPFGATPYQDAGGETLSYSFDLSFRNNHGDPGLAQFYSKMKQLNEVLLNTAVARSSEWFGKKMAKDVVGEFLRPVVKEPKDPQYSATMKTKVPVGARDKQPVAFFFDERGDRVSIDYVAKGSTLQAILELSSVWFVGKNSFGTTWKVLQAQVLSKARRDTFAFIATPGAPVPPAGEEDEHMHGEGEEDEVAGGLEL